MFKEPKDKKRRDTPSSIGDAINKAKENREKAIEKRRSKNKGKAWGAKDLLAEWTHSVNEAHYDVHTTVEESFILKKAMKKHMEMGNKPDFIELMTFSIQHWTVIMNMKFWNATSKPEQPAIRWFVKCLPSFIEVYQQNEKVKNYKMMTTKEQMIQALIDNGKDKDTAEKEVDERLGLKKLRDEIKEEREKLQLLQNENDRAKEVEERRALLNSAVKRKEARNTCYINSEGTFDLWE